MNPSFSDITYFLEAANSGNISRAAERLGITQPSLSSAIKRLEDSIGTTLFIRGRKGVELTKAGHELATQGRLLLSQWEQLRGNINKKQYAVSGQFIIGCHPSVALFSLGRILPSLLLQYPELEIKLEHAISREITEQIISFKIDFGIVVNPVRHPDLVIQKLCTDDVIFWTRNKPTKLQNLHSGEGVLICDQNLTQTQKIQQDLQKHKLKFKRIIQSSNLEVIRDLIASGLGIGILPSKVATKNSSQKLVPYGEGLPKFKDTICLVYRADAQKTAGSRVIIDQIKKYF